MTWDLFIEQESHKAYYKSLMDFIKSEELTHDILPPKGYRLSCFNLTPYKDIKVVILGQDPYHNYHQAHGLAFSVLNDKYPPSLKNIYKELISDLGVSYPKTGNLTSWAKQGVFLLNTVLTVRAHEPLSHQKKGWEIFTLEAIKEINKKNDGVVFILWGNHAIRFSKYIDSSKHKIITSVHPSPLSARRGFFGSKPFSKTNEYLKSYGYEPINWDLS
ncbi:uracil-DNA glycosylase [Mariniplasma anaerobium]|uniref:Uracil-DNA glycosylase n=1 Tax=Mariniplasma anaerobium TaxID=2735436 RepID=A0A7U9XWH4_9MOLU|nr:uracil-DNA glycosylase [Mariniplasma anaerobium]BCR36534.1 uracil-DNA glycosylase 2 [Mariniplasma anaerobium]